MKLKSFVYLLFIIAMLASCEKDSFNNDEVNDVDKYLSHEGMVNRHRCVDLGLSVNWADTELGGYYAWGELKSKSKYLPSTYTYFKENRSLLNVLGSEISGTKYDVATYEWDKPWRMPTNKEFKELIEKCKWEWTTYGQYSGNKSTLYGYKVTGVTGKSIFIPVNGWYSGKDHSNTDQGMYWSGSFIGDNLVTTDSRLINYGVQALGFDKNGGPKSSLFCAYHGLGVWPVTDSDGERIVNPEYDDDDDGDGDGDSGGGGTSGLHQSMGKYNSYVLKVYNNEVVGHSNKTVELLKNTNSGSIQFKVGNSWCTLRRNSRSTFLGYDVSDFNYVATYIPNTTIVYYYYFDI